MTTSGCGFGCNTYAWIRAMRADECLARLAGHGFAQFEIMVHPGHLWPGERAGISALKQVLADHSLRVTTLNLPNLDINITSEIAEMREHSLAMLEAALSLAGELGAPGFVLGPGKANALSVAPRDLLNDHLFRALDRLCPVAERAGTALWVENLPFGYEPAIDPLMAILDAYGNDAVGVTYDVANAHFIGEEIGPGLMRCAPRLKLVHLSDTGQSAFRHDPVGWGTVPFASLPPLLEAAGYCDAPMLEILSDDPDRDLPASAAALAKLGLGRAD